MLERNNVWEYGEGLLQACISSFNHNYQHFQKGTKRMLGVVASSSGKPTSPFPRFNIAATKTLTPLTLCKFS